MPYDPQVHHRRSVRLKGYDYASPGAYFVTLCTHERQSLLGQVNEGEMHLSAYGLTVRACWEDLPRHYPGLELDAFVVMPTHVHAILVLTQTGEEGRAAAAPSARYPLSEVIRGFKTYSARRINKRRDTRGNAVWQRNYYERIIRNERELEAIRAYIESNPAQWAQDRERADREPEPGPVP